MSSNYLIISKDILPDYFDKVIQAKKLIETNQVKGVSEAVRKVGISRSTYYKYKDYIFEPSQNFGRKATLSFVLLHYKGVLSNILNTIAEHNGNILTISQDIPINDNALVSITLEIDEMDLSIDDLIEKIANLKGVASAKLVAIE